jgi:hypothetical protein
MTIDLDLIEVSTEIVEIRGIRLPYRDARRDEKPEEGVVFVPLSLLHEIAEQGEWDSQFGSVLLIHDRHQELALEQAGLGVKETKGGFHRSPTLEPFMEKRGWR